MTKDQAKLAIVKLWREWVHANGTDSISTDMQLFYGWLRTNRSDTLTFKASGDKWQVVKGWIQDR